MGEISLQRPQVLVCKKIHIFLFQMTSQGGLRGWTWTYIHVASMSDMRSICLHGLMGLGQPVILFHIYGCNVPRTSWAQTTIEGALFHQY